MENTKRCNFLHIEHSFADQSDSKSNGNNESGDVRNEKSAKENTPSGENVCINDVEIEKEDESDTIKNDAKINSEKYESTDNSSLLESHL